ncbi:hypothetical protein GGR57DRAFT_484837 [Xylariaceae sp. FL1272]|nr:hypothetical protein GGR57DRAFT_484837 [Xylariaceae sp. FL1272]
MEKLEQLATRNIKRWGEECCGKAPKDDKDMIEVFLENANQLNTVEPNWIIQSLLKRGIPPATDQEREEILQVMFPGFRHRFKKGAYELLDAELLRQVILQAKEVIISSSCSDTERFELRFKHLNYDIPNSMVPRRPLSGGVWGYIYYWDMPFYVCKSNACKGEHSGWGCDTVKTNTVKQCLNGHGLEAWADLKWKRIWHNYLVSWTQLWYEVSHSLEACKEVNIEIVSEKIVWKPRAYHEGAHTTTVTMAHLAAGKRDGSIESIEVEFRTHLKPLEQVKEVLGKVLPRHH